MAEMKLYELVNHYHIGMSLLPRMFLDIPSIILRQHILRSSDIKFRIPNTINLSIIPCIFNCLRYNLHPLDLFSLLGQKQ